MPTTAQLRSRLVAKLKELFQLDQPDLDFGFYRIMHAKAKQVTEFLEKDLLQVIEDTFGHQADQQSTSALAAARRELEEALGADALDGDGQLKEAFAPLPAGKRYLDALAKAEAAKEALSAEGEIYDHLHRFFERYYEDGDFISRRYFSRETAGRAAPFAIPYNGEEVKLHWANADQYYIKTGEYFAHFTVDLAKAPEAAGELKLANNDLPMPVHFRVVDVAEGEHGNVKASENSKRFFILHVDDPAGFNDKGELELRFEYRPDPDKPEKSQEGKWQEELRARAVERLLATLAARPEAAAYHRLLAARAPTEANKDRTLLAKYLHQYTARNTADYFIHKDLGSFLRRELDFYIKNEVMRLDDIENEDAPRVESYLAKLKILRTIARQLIAFLAQLEDFQKKLWLKKKFVVETNYGITLDRVPEELYPEIAANDAQREEWVKLYAIDDIEGRAAGDLLQAATPGYSSPLSVEFLKSQPHLVLNTRHFSGDFKARVVATIENFDEHCEGLLLQSDNFDGLRLLGSGLRQTVDCVCIDPPYNTGSDGFCYKDGFKSASWLTQQAQLIPQTLSMLVDDGSFFAFNDENEIRDYSLLLESLFRKENFVETIIWNKRIPKNDKGIGNIHDFILLLSKDLDLRKKRKKSYSMRKDELDEIYDLIRRMKDKGSDLGETQLELKKFYRKQGYDRGITLYCELDPSYKVWGKINMSWPNAKTEGPRYKVISPATGKEVPIPDNGWRWKEETFRKAESDGPTYKLPDGSIVKGRIWYSTKETVQPSSITYLEEVESFLLRSILSVKSDGSRTLENLGLGGIFDYPKSVLLIERLLHSTGSTNGIFLDYFGGSGTTAQAIINLNRDDQGCRKYTLIEMGEHFDTVLKKRIAKVVYAPSGAWDSGLPLKRNQGISHCFKYVRLESYEDTLNNLRFTEDAERERALAANDPLRRDYTLNYLLDVETRGSQSLLNLDGFSDPTAYTLKVKKPGASGSEPRPVDLIETFNFLIGLRLVHLAAPQRFTATFQRVPDPDLPQGTDTRLQLAGKMRQSPDGAWWFRKVEGWVPKDRENPHNGQKEKILIVWRTLTGNLEEDNLMLDEWFQKNRLSTRDFEFDTIYVNGSNNLPNLKLASDTWKVRLLEEEFHKAMWDVADI